MWVRLKSTGRRMRLFLKSIRFRLTMWSAGVLAVILVLFCLFVYSRQSMDLQTEVRTELEVKAQQVNLVYRMLGAFEHFGQGPDITTLTQREGDVLQNNDALVVVDPNGQIYQQSGPIDQNTAQQLIQAWEAANQGHTPSIGITSGMLSPKNGKKQRYTILITPMYLDRGAVGLMIIAQPTDPQGQLPRLAFTLVLGSLATIALVLAGGFWVAERAIAPVRTITRTARQIGETDLNRRLRLNSQDELGELASTFDAMLDRLQAAFDRQRQFTADASHELRTPLTIVGLETEHALERRRTNDDYERALRVIQSENQFMAHLVNDLLTLARMDAGQAVVRKEALDLSDVTLDVVERLTPLAHRDGVELISGEMPEVCVPGDRQYLAQMLTNLVENAIKYSGGTGKHVWVETGSETDGGAGRPAYGWVRVIDDGPGIPSEHLAHLFDRFYRVDQSRMRAAESESEKGPGGSGLGLSIVQWIARAHGGEITVQSEVGKGTSFEARLPLN